MSTNRCGYCGELWYSTLSVGDQYRCGTIVSADQQIQHNYCRRLCGDAAHGKVRRPAMMREQRNKTDRPSRRTRWSHIRDALIALKPGQTHYFPEVDRSAANRALYVVAEELPYRVIFRHDRGAGYGCHASMVGDVDGMEPGESRLYSDNLKHTVTRLAVMNEDALRGRDGAGVYTMDLVDNIYWIRRLL